jgi:hypothetical protein
MSRVNSPGQFTVTGQTLLGDCPIPQAWAARKQGNAEVKLNPRALSEVPSTPDSVKVTEIFTRYGMSVLEAQGA